MLLDDLIEEGAMIWLRERDGEPCSLRRARLLQMCRELVTGAPWVPPVERGALPVDGKSLAAHDDTFADEEGVP